MKNFEREEANISELEQIGEFVVFPAEDYKCKEHYLNKNEDFKVQEIQPQSFVDNNETKKSNSKINRKRRIERNLKTSLNTSTSASVASSGIATLTAVAVVAGVASIPLFISCGTVDFINYRIDISDILYDQDYLLSKCAYIYFDEKLNDGFEAKVINTENSEQVILDKELDYVYFDNLTLNQYRFEVQIVDENNKIEDSYYIDIDTTCEIEFSNESNYEYLITYNDDGTANFYYYPILDYDENYDLENKIIVSDEEGNIYCSIDDEKNGVFSVEGLSLENFNITFLSYLKNNGNYYMVNRSEVFDISTHYIFWYANVDFDKLTLYIDAEANDRFKVRVDYLDLATSEEFNLTSYELNNSFNNTISLSSISESMNITIEGEFKSSNENNYIHDYKGSLYTDYSDTKEINQIVDSFFNLERIEILNGSYDDIQSGDSISIPTKIYLDGYLKDESYISINIYDSVNNLLDCYEKIRDIDETITFYNLDSTQLLKMEIVLYNSSNDILDVQYYDLNNSIPEEYNNLSYSVYSPNPGDVYQTYNDDGTFNAYFDMVFENNTNYDLVYKIELYQDSKVKYSLISSSRIGVIEDINIGEYWINYSYLLKDGNIYYAIGDLTYPSGSIGVTLDENGYVVSNSIYSIPFDTPGIYDICISKEVFSDLDIKLLFDGISEETKTVVYNETNDYEYVFTLDLSNYDFTYVDVEVIGVMNNQNENRQEIENYCNVKGNKGCLTKLSLTIYK